MLLYFTQRNKSEVTCHNCAVSDQLTPCSRVFIEKLIVPKIGENFPTFMELQGSLPCSQQPTTCSCLDDINPVHALSSYVFKTHLLLSTHESWGLSDGLVLFKYGALVEWYGQEKPKYWECLYETSLLVYHSQYILILTLTVKYSASLYNCMLLGEGQGPSNIQLHTNVLCVTVNININIHNAIHKIRTDFF